MAKAIMVSIRPEQIEQICGAGAQVEVRKAYTMERGNGSKLYLYCPGGADRQVWIGARRAYVDDHAHAGNDVCGSGKVIANACAGTCCPSGPRRKARGCEARGCRHHYDDIPGLCCSFGPCVDSIISPDDFCSYGERRESDEQAP